MELLALQLQALPEVPHRARQLTTSCLDACSLDDGVWTSLPVSRRADKDGTQLPPQRQVATRALDALDWALGSTKLSLAGEDLQLFFVGEDQQDHARSTAIKCEQLALLIRERLPCSDEEHSGSEAGEAILALSPTLSLGSEDAAAAGSAGYPEYSLLDDLAASLHALVGGDSESWAADQRLGGDSESRAALSG